jgi:glutamine synthetase
MDNLQELPTSLEKALNLARNSEFVRDNLPENVRKLTFRHICSQLEALKEYDSTEQFCDEYYFPYI